MIKIPPGPLQAGGRIRATAEDGLRPSDSGSERERSARDSDYSLRMVAPICPATLPPCCDVVFVSELKFLSPSDAPGRGECGE